jgi:hypothetical protein
MFLCQATANPSRGFGAKLFQLIKIVQTFPSYNANKNRLTYLMTRGMTKPMVFEGQFAASV